MKEEKIKGRPKRQVDKRGRRTSADGALATIVERKFDNSKNADEDKLARVMRQQAEKEKHLFPLRINTTTVIYVTADKCNEKYREEYLTNKYRKL